MHRSLLFRRTVIVVSAQNESADRGEATLAAASKPQELGCTMKGRNEANAGTSDRRLLTSLMHTA